MWKLNPSLLENQKYIAMMTEFLSQWSAPPKFSNPCSTWEWLKHEIKRVTMQFSKENVPLEKQLLKNLTRDLQDLTERADAGEHLSEQISSVCRELAEVEEIRANKLIFRACTRWTHLGEKPTAYYLNLEKRKAKYKMLSTLLLEDRSTTNDSVSILEKCSCFYETLYSEGEDSLTPVDDIWRDIEHLEHPKLLEQESILLDSPISEEELKKVLSHLNRGKCPGTDGICPEFYAKFWTLLSPFLLGSLSYSVDIDLLSMEGHNLGP